MEKSDEQLLVPRDTYLTAGAHIGTKFRTKDMAPFIYKITAEGLSVLNIQKINERLELAGKLLAKYEPKDILVVGRRENSWKAIKAFAKVTGTKEYAGRYPAGIITNPRLETYFEPKILLVTDPWPDKNAVCDAKLAGLPVIALCDTNNTLADVDLCIPCNNKGAKSLGLVYWILANQFLRERGDIPRTKEIDVPLADFSD